MTFQTPTVYALLCVALIMLATRTMARHRPVVLAGFSAVFVLLFLGGSVRAIAALWCFLLFDFAAIRLMSALDSSSGRQAVFWIWLCSALTAFVVLKQYWWLTDLFVDRDAISWGITTTGLSFVFFRQVGLTV